ncbi:MAG: DUF4838 domain-containing protein [Lentisphaeria bacterium]|nr:DUF4838 domain-containing protein [Lentisphaeria bacterium]
MRHCLPLIGSFLLAAGTLAWGAPFALVRDGASQVVIYHAPDAPTSVQQGVEELRDYVREATGAELAIVQEPRTPMVCIGDNAAARAAGIRVTDIPLEGFRILTKDGNLYIVGNDTEDGERTPAGGTSNGTRNGAYVFLEKFLGIRWLMPGEHGDYVPKTTSVTIPETDLSDAPFFLNRRVPYTQQRRPEVIRWWARQRLGWSLALSHGHNWRRPIPASLFDEHPDWFPMRGGMRVPPTGRYKLCTTNPGLIRAFADAAIAHFDARPESTSYSLSPSDSAGYCECPNCLKLYEPDPHGKRSVTPAILTFYNAVARLVAQKYPDKKLAGYVYAGYVYPPRVPIKLEPNVFLVWAPSFDYGYTLFRPGLQTEWEALLAQWGKVTENISYYDLPVNVSTELGTPNPPGLKILKFLYPRLKKAKIKGVYVYGISAWGRAAPLNYLLARLAWNPDADVEALFDEYCAKAYGQGGDDINRMVRLLDTETERHFLEFENARYSLTTDMMRDIYAKNWDEMERLVCAAEAKVQDPDAKARLATIGMNLTVLHWGLRQFGIFKGPKPSAFQLSDEDFFAFLREHRGSLALHPGGKKSASRLKQTQLVLAPVRNLPNAEETTRFKLRGSQHLLIHPLGGGTTEVQFSQITARGKLITYSVYGADGEEVTSGLMSGEVPVRLDAAGSPHFHLIISAGSASFEVTVKGGAWAVRQPPFNRESQGLHMLAQVTPLYFEVPEGTKSFHLSMQATPPGETAVATLFAPDGRAVEQYNCTEMPVDRKNIVPGAADYGWWKLVIREAQTGVLDDVWVQQGKELSGWFSLVPGQALGVTPIGQR